MFISPLVLTLFAHVVLDLSVPYLGMIRAAKSSRQWTVNPRPFSFQRTANQEIRGMIVKYISDLRNVTNDVKILG